MEGFSYNNIFETKGIEYLVIIAFLILIIPFWYILNRRKLMPETADDTIMHPVFNLNIPMGIFFSRNHTWAYLESSGLVKTGIDDFLFRVTGRSKLNIVRQAGESIKKGDLIAEVLQDGKKLRISSPVTGRISEVNSFYNGFMHEQDPYGEAWIYKMVPADWKAETRSYFLAEEARGWLNREVERFRDMIAGFTAGHNPGNLMPVLQDGGELIGHPLAELPEEAWTLFEKSFLTLEDGT